MNLKTAPLWQWILLIIVSFFLGFVGYGMVAAADELLHSPVGTLMASLVLMALYVLFVRWFEKEWAPDVLAIRGIKDLSWGSQ